ncbi:MAG: hypothetical protein ACTSUE_22035 [Promethearchaeota archaeon]
MTKIKRQQAISRRSFMQAMNEIPRIMTSADSVSLKQTENFIAVFYDFINHELEMEVTREKITNLIGNVLDTDSKRLILICLGFLSNRDVLPTIKEIVNETKKQVDMVDYIVKELLLLALYTGKVVSPEMILTDDERKEEIARKLLVTFKLHVDGETSEESRSILENIDSVEIQKLTNELEVKIRKQIEDMLAAEAAAAAAKPSRE